MLPQTEENSFLRCKWLLAIGLMLVATAAFLSACQKPEPRDMRQLVPADAFVYLETSDTGALLQTLLRGRQGASRVNFSALQNTQAAMAVTGFDTSEKEVAADTSIFNVKPLYAVILETHASMTVSKSIVEDKIASFVSEKLGEDAKLEKAEKDGATVYFWTVDGKKRFGAAAIGSLIYLSNDETVLEKCLAVLRGAADSALKNEGLTRAKEASGPNHLAFGYISQDGVNQISALAGVATAINSSEEDIVRSFVAKSVPTILQKNVREVVWTSDKTDSGIEDKVLIKLDAETLSVFKETLVAGSDNRGWATVFIPATVNSVTRYNLKNSQIAWRSVLLTASRPLDPVNARILGAVSGSLFEPYGIADSEAFLSSVDSDIFTVRFDEEGDESVVIAKVKDHEKLRNSITKEIILNAEPEERGTAKVWKSADNDLAFALADNILILGERESVLKCLKVGDVNQTFIQSRSFNAFLNSKVGFVTLTKSAAESENIAEIFGKAKNADAFYLIESRITDSGIERKITSSDGYPGALIQKLFDGE